jgi:hypothetical protein
MIKQAARRKQFGPLLFPDSTPCTLSDNVDKLSTLRVAGAESVGRFSRRPYDSRAYIPHPSCSSPHSGGHVKHLLSACPCLPDCAKVTHIDDAPCRDCAKMTQRFTLFSFAAQATSHAHCSGIGSRLDPGLLRALFGLRRASFCTSRMRGESSLARAKATQV